MTGLYKLIKSFSDRAKQVEKRTVVITAVIIAIFVAIWLLYIYHINDFSRAYRNAMDDLIMAETVNGNEHISAGFFERSNAVRYCAVTFSNADIEKYTDIIPVALPNVLASGLLDEVVFIDAEGLVHFPDNTVTDEYNTANVVSQCDIMSPYSVFKNTDDFILGKESFGVIAPVKRGNVVNGYVCGLIRYDSLKAESLIDSELEHDEIILDEKGHVLVKIESSGKIITDKSSSDFFEMAEEYMTAKDFSTFIFDYKESINSLQPNYSIIKTGNQEILYIYHPIEGTNGWSIMNCYPDSVIEKRTTKIRLKSFIIFLTVFALFFIAVIVIQEYIKDERKKFTDLKFLDGLTGVYNRNAFVARTNEIFSENKNLPYNIICFDIINFRIINETYGHERSDELIKAVADACKEAIGHNESFGRLTADVYAAAVIDDGEEEDRIKFIEDFVAKRAKEVYINHPIRLKRGVYSVFGEEESVDRMIDKANIARKYVDYLDSTFVCHYTSELMNEARRIEQIESRMEESLRRGEFKPYLQAKYDIVENKVYGAEALVRWIRPDGEVIPPIQFIPIFERNGFVEKIDFYILEEVCKYIRRMIDEGRDVYKVSVNQSRYLMNDPEYASKIRQILLRYQIPVGLIELELTETVFLHEKDRMIKMMNDLKKMNVDLAIDDFGTGYSSFNILKDVPFDVLKIDKVFLTDAVRTEKGKFILKEIVHMGHGLGMSVICEGVETEEQAELLRSFGCSHAQGFLYARPVSMEEFIEKYNTKKE